jgi:hypothetical protein
MATAWLLAIVPSCNCNTTCTVHTFGVCISARGPPPQIAGAAAPPTTAAGERELSF